jgi:hypothetical protein
MYFICLLIFIYYLIYLFTYICLYIYLFLFYFLTFYFFFFFLTRAEWSQPRPGPLPAISPPPLLHFLAFQLLSIRDQSFTVPTSIPAPLHHHHKPIPQITTNLQTWPYPPSIASPIQTWKTRFHHEASFTVPITQLSHQLNKPPPQPHPYHQAVRALTPLPVTTTNQTHLSIKPNHTSFQPSPTWTQITSSPQSINHPWLHP